MVASVSSRAINRPGPPSPRRFIVLLAFCLLTMTNAWQWITWSSVSTLVAERWGVSYDEVNGLSTIYMYIYISLAFPAFYIMDRRGLRVALLIGAFLNLLGSVVHVSGASLAGRSGYLYAYVGQTFAGVAQLFTLAVPPLLATSWFKADEVSLASALGVASNQCGSALGLGITGIVVTSIEEDLAPYLWVQTVLCLLSFVLILIFVSDVPPLDPKEPLPPIDVDSPTHRHKKHPDRSSFESADPTDHPHHASFKTDALLYLNTVRSILSSRSVVLLSLSYGISTGVFYAYATFLSQLLPTWSTPSSSSLGLVVILVGLCGSLVGGAVLDKGKAFQPLNRLYVFTAFLGMCLWFFVSKSFPESRAGLYVVGAIVGFSLTGSISIGFEYAVELTYPLNEGTVAGVLNVAANVGGVVLILLGSGMNKWLSAEDSINAINAYMLTFEGVAALLVCVAINDTAYKRQLAQETQEKTGLMEPMLENQDEEGKGEEGRYGATDAVTIDVVKVVASGK